MKKIYASPEIEITAFSTEDIITTSGGGMNTVDDTYDLTGNNNDVVMDMNNAN